MAVTRDCSTITCRRVDAALPAECAGGVSRGRNSRVGKQAAAGESAAREAASAQGDRLMDTSRMAEATACGVALVSVVALVPLIRRLCFRWGLFDAPRHLKIHREPVPRLGGVAMVCALTAGIATGLHGARSGSLFFAAALGLVWLVGFLDDLREVAPFFRLLAQIGGAALPYGGGWRIAVFSSSAFGTFAQCLLVILFVNAFNFLDGVDGLAAVIALGVCAGSQRGAQRVRICRGVEFAGSLRGVFIFQFSAGKNIHGGFGEHGAGFHRGVSGTGFYRSARCGQRGEFTALPIYDCGLADLGCIAGGDAESGDQLLFFDGAIGGWLGGSGCCAGYGGR
jgi:hypothetical protein